LSDGTSKPIEELISGEELLVYDENTHSLQKAFNLEVKKFISNNIVTILLENGDRV
jgi:hypothetical protein